MINLRRILFVLFFLSGLAALIYEVTWARKLSLIFGTTTYAVSSILAVFFAGLALGSFIFGRWIDKKGRPLKTYAILELGIGLYAMATPWLFKLIEGLQIAFWQRFEPAYFGFSIFTFGLSFLILIIPTTLMGGTLPVLSKFWVRREEEVGGGVGALYFINTAGAVLGAFLAGFLLIAAIGVNETILTAAVVNLLIGGIVLAFSGKRLAVREEKRLEKKDQETLYAKPYTLNPILIAFGLAGFSALALEVLWTRVMVMVFGGSIYAFTIVLVTFLLGIALGSAVGSAILGASSGERLASREKLNAKPYTLNPLILFAGIEILLGVSVILLTPLLGDLPFWFLSIYKNFGQSFGGLQFGLFLLAFMVMILPTLLMGMAFPVVVKAYSVQRLGSRVGEIYAANTIGGIFGALVAGFVFIPAVGVQKGIWLAGSIYLLIGVGLVFYIIRSFTKIRFKFAFISIIALSLLVILIGFNLPSWNKSVLSSGFYKEPFFYLGKVKKEVETVISTNKILFYEEGLGATISVAQDLFDRSLALIINGKTDASTGADMENQVLSGHLPMLFHQDPKSVLVIGLGSGVTLGSVEQSPVETIDMVEIEPAVVEAASYFADYNHNALKDKRVNLIIADGRNYLLAVEKRYDVITSEPSNLWLTGVSNLFTKEFYQSAKEHLNENGVMVQWLHLYAMGENDLKTAVRTFYEVFPQSLAFNVFTSHDMLLIGGKEKLVLDLEQIKTRMSQEKVRVDLARVGISSPFDILVYLTMDKGAIEKFSQGGALHTDNQPVLEFSAPKSLYLPTQASSLKRIMEFWVDISALKSKEIKEFREHFAKMMIASAESNMGEAIEEGELAREIRNDHPGLNRRLARLYFEKTYFLLKEQKRQEVKENLLRSLEILPTSQARNILGSIYFDEGKLDLAQEQFEEVIEESPELSETHFNLGLVLEQIGDLNRAIEEFEKVLELDPEYSGAHEKLAKLYEMRGDYGKAEEHRKLKRE